MKHLNLTELLSVPLLLVWKNIVIILSYVTGFTSAMQQVSIQAFKDQPVG